MKTKGLPRYAGYQPKNLMKKPVRIKECAHEETIKIYGTKGSIVDKLSF